MCPTGGWVDADSAKYCARNDDDTCTRTVPLCAPFATALLAAGNSRHRTLSLCLGHMDEQALLAVACHLDRARAITGLTINDSLTVWRESLPFPATTLAQVASTAASSALGIVDGFEVV